MNVSMHERFACTCRTVTREFLYPEQEISGEELLDLGRSATVDQLKECGLKSVGQQLKLRRLLRPFMTEGSSPAGPAGAVSIIASSATHDLSASSTTELESSRRDRKLTLSELAKLSHGMRNTYIAK